MNKRNYAGGRPVSVRIPDTLYAEIQCAAEKTGFSQLDIIRLAIRAGLADIASIDYDIGKTITDAARTLTPLVPFSDTPKGKATSLITFEEGISQLLGRPLTPEEQKNVAEFQRQRKRGEQLRDADRADQQSSSRSRRQPKA